MFSDAEIRAVLCSQEFKEAFDSGGEFDKFIASAKKFNDPDFSVYSVESWKTFIDEEDHKCGSRRSALRDLKMIWPDVFELFSTKLNTDENRKAEQVAMWQSAKFKWPEITRFVWREYFKIDFDALNKEDQKKATDSITSQTKNYAKTQGITLRKGHGGRPINPK